MTSAYPLDPFLSTANDEFKARYGQVLRWSVLIALALVILLFLVSPRYEPRPYHRPRQEILVIDLETPVVPPPVREPSKPPPDFKAAPDPQVVIDPEFNPTLISPIDIPIPAVPEPDVFTGPGFVASVTNPRLLAMVAPVYPEIARMSRLEGKVVVSVKVGTGGSVVAVQVLEGANPILNKAAMDAAWKCRFEPGRQHGQAVAVWMAIPYHFRLN
jgi:TonB family protein